jgi:hypothetical protein
LIDAARVALMNAGSLLKEKIKRLGQSNLSEEQKLSRTPVKAKPADPLATDVGLQKVRWKVRHVLIRFLEKETGPTTWKIIPIILIYHRLNYFTVAF